MRERRSAKIAAISCTHSPFTPPETQEWLLSQLSNIPDLTHFGHLGDVFEAGAASVHANEFDHSLQDEYEHAHNLLQSKSLRNLVDWNAHPEYGKEFRDWCWVPYEKSRKGVFRVGQCHFYHGFDSAQNSDELEGLQILGACNWVPFSLTVRGHTHRPVQPTQCRRTAKIPLPFWYSNVGTCGPLKPDYMKRKDTSQWGTAIIVVECLWDRPSRLNGRCWNAELIRMP